MWCHFLLLCALQIVGSSVPGRVQYQQLQGDTYRFGYDTGTGPSQSFRDETRDSNGTVRGRYGYIDPLGTLRIVEYMADNTGFHILSSLQLTSLQLAKPIKKPPTTKKPKPKKRKPVQLPFIGAIPPFLSFLN